MNDYAKLINLAYFWHECVIHCTPDAAKSIFWPDVERDINKLNIERTQ